MGETIIRAISVAVCVIFSAVLAFVVFLVCFVGYVSFSSRIAYLEDDLEYAEERRVYAEEREKYYREKYEDELESSSACRAEISRVRRESLTCWKDLLDARTRASN